MTSGVGSAAGSGVGGGPRETDQIDGGTLFDHLAGGGLRADDAAGLDAPVRALGALAFDQAGGVEQGERIALGESGHVGHGDERYR